MGRPDGRQGRREALGTWLMPRWFVSSSLMLYLISINATTSAVRLAYWDSWINILSHQSESKLPSKQDNTFNNYKGQVTLISNSSLLWILPTFSPSLSRTIFIFSSIYHLYTNFGIRGSIEPSNTALFNLSHNDVDNLKTWRTNKLQPNCETCPQQWCRPWNLSSLPT